MSLVLVHSPKGGVGSTTIAANLALALALDGHDVAALDLTGQDVLGLHLGNRPDVAATANLRSDDQVVVISGVHFLSTGARRAEDTMVDRLLQRARVSDAVIVVDLAGGDHATLDRLMPEAKLHLCVVSPDPGCIALLPRMLDGLDATPTRFVINKADDRIRLRRDAAAFLRTTLQDGVIGVVRRDEAVPESLALIEPLSSHAPASAALADMNTLAGAVAVLLDRPARPEAKLQGAA